MERHRVPTARFRVCDSADAALAASARGEFGYPLVLKADGLAAGKGVVIAEDRAAAEAAVRHAMVDRRFGGAGERIVLEEFLVGEEASYFVLADGERRACRSSSAQDHKRIFDDDRGPEHRRHGRVCAEPAVDAGDRAARARRDRPPGARRAWSARATRFAGFLYVGPDADGRRPEGDRVQRAVRRSRSAGRAADARRGSVVAARARRRPARCRRAPRTFRDEPHVGVVLAAGGYPGRSEERQADHRSRRGGRGARRAGVSCRHEPATTASSSPLAAACSPSSAGARRIARRSTSRTGGGARPLRRDAVSARHRPKGAGRMTTQGAVRCAVVTFGCRVNQADSLAIEAELLARGRDQAPPEQADLVVVNTCSVTASADQGARQTIRRIVAQNPACRSSSPAVTRHARPDEVARAAERHSRRAEPDKDSLVTLLGDTERVLTTAERFGDGDGPCGRRCAGRRRAARRSRLRVQTGCEERCSYCIIPRRGAPAARRRSTASSPTSSARSRRATRRSCITGVHLARTGATCATVRR